MLEIIAIVVPVSGVIAAVVVFWRNVLTTRKLNLEIDKLKKEIEEKDRKIAVPTIQEIEKYGKSLSGIRSSFPVILVLFFVAGSLPMFVETYYGLSNAGYGASNPAKEIQNELWAKNLECSLAPSDPITTPDGGSIDVTICKSGDVLIRVTKDDKGYYQWVEYNFILQNNP